MLELENLIKERNIGKELRLENLTLEEWKSKREEIKNLFLKEVYGFLPKKLVPTIDKELCSVDFAGKASWESIYFTFENNGKTHKVKTELILPKEKQNIPVFLYISFSPDVPNKYLPVEEILDNGFGIFTFYYENVTKDGRGYEDDLGSLFDKDELTCGKISMWAYMVGVMRDYLETRSEVGPASVVGHSRLGKTALLASALDDRFVLTCSNDSGCSGAALSRGKKEGNEAIGDICKVFPFWFTTNYYKYIENEEAQPFDQHMLLSLVAPRCLMIGGAEKDYWADNEGQMLSCYLASPVWKLYGKEGLVINKVPCEGDKFLKGNVTYHQRGGTHFLSRADWQVYMEKFSELLRGKNEI